MFFHIFFLIEVLSRYFLSKPLTFENENLLSRTYLAVTTKTMDKRKYKNILTLHLIRFYENVSTYFIFRGIFHVKFVIFFLFHL